jgi:hypothetical protein
MTSLEEVHITILSDKDVQSKLVQIKVNVSETIKPNQYSFETSRSRLQQHSTFFEIFLNESGRFADQVELRSNGYVSIDWIVIVKTMKTQIDCQQDKRYNWYHSWELFVTLLNWKNDSDHVDEPLAKKLKTDSGPKLSKDEFVKEMSLVSMSDLFVLTEYFQCLTLNELIQTSITDKLMNLNLFREAISHEYFFDVLLYWFHTKLDNIENIIVTNFNLDDNAVKNYKIQDYCSIANKLLERTIESHGAMNSVIPYFQHFLWSLPLRSLLSKLPKDNASILLCSQWPKAEPICPNKACDFFKIQLHFPARTQKEVKDPEQLVWGSMDQFQNNWKEITCSAFDNDFPWNKNVVVAGGSIVTCLRDDYSFKNESVRYSDIDLFILQQDKTSFVEVIRYFDFKYSNVRAFFGLSRSIVTIVIPGLARNFQVILTRHRSIEHLLLHFDLDYVRAGFDGKQIYFFPECFLAHATMICHWNPGQHWNHLHRLKKTMKKGFNLSTKLSILNPNSEQKSKTTVQELLENIAVTIKHFCPQVDDFADFIQSTIKSIFKVPFVYHGGRAGKQAFEFYKRLDNMGTLKTLEQYASDDDEKTGKRCRIYVNEIKGTRYYLNSKSYDKLQPQMIQVMPQKIRRTQGDVVYIPLEFPLDVIIARIPCRFANGGKEDKLFQMKKEQLVFDVSDLEVTHKLFDEIDNNIISQIITHSAKLPDHLRGIKRLSDKSISVDQFKGALCKSIRNPEDKQNYGTFGVRVNAKTKFTHAFTLESFDLNQFSQCKGRSCSIHVHCSDVWISRHNFGIVWTASEVNVFPKNYQKNVQLLQLE